MSGAVQLICTKEMSAKITPLHKTVFISEELLFHIGQMTPGELPYVQVTRGPRIPFRGGNRCHKLITDVTTDRLLDYLWLLGRG